MSNSAINVLDVLARNRVGARQWVLIALCAFVMFIDGFDTQVISYIMPALSKAWHISPAVKGTIFSSALFGLMVGYLVISPLSDRFGHKRMMIAAMLMFGVFTLLTVMISGVDQLIALRFLTGIGLGAAAPSAIALTCEYSPPRLRSSFVLLIYFGYSLGFSVAGFVAGAMLPKFGWHSVLWTGALFPLVLTVLLWAGLPESLAFLARREDSHRRIGGLLRKMFPGESFSAGATFATEQGDQKRAAIVSLFSDGRGFGTVLLWLVFVINLAEFYFMQSWLPTILTNLHYPMATIVWATSLTTIGGMVAVFVIGPAMDRLGAYLALTAVYLLGAAFSAVLAFAFSASPAVLLTAAFLAGFCVSGGQKSVIALAAIYYPTHVRSTGVGWALGVGRLGGIAGPLLGGLMFTAHWTPAAAFNAAAVPLLLAGAGVYAMHRAYGRRAPAKG